MINIAIIITSISFSSLAHVFLRKGMSNFAEIDNASGLYPLVIGAMCSPWVLGGVTLHVLALGVWVIALNRVEITFAYPFLALGYVFVALLAWYWLGEQLSAMRVAGMVIVVIGIIFISKS